MTEITTKGQRMKAAADALARLSRNPMEVMTKVRLNALTSGAGKVWAAWWTELDPVIRRYTEQPKAETAAIDHTHPKWEDFNADPEAADLLSQELTIDVRPLKLSELVAAEARADRQDRHFEVSSTDLELLMGMGFIVDDVSDAAEEAPPKKPARQKRAKAKA